MIHIRTIEIERDVIQTTNGSTRVRIGSTEILVGVKAELEKPALKTPSQGKSKSKVYSMPHTVCDNNE